MKFSIIIPIYNCERYLKDCLDSVLNQTYENWECICVNDGSTDNSGKIADEYASKDNRFRVVHKVNGGEGSARNAGLDVFSGDWVYFLDSDDILNSEVLEICNQGISLYPGAELISVKTIQFNDGEICRWESINPVSWQYLDITKHIDSRAYGMSVWSIAYKAALVKNRRFTSLKIGADRVFVMSVIEEASKVALTDYTGYGYRARIGSAVNTPMTDEKFLADLTHRMLWIKTFSHSNKHYDQALINSFAKALTEYMSSCYFAMPSKTQKKVMPILFASLLEASRFRRFNTVRKAIMRICGYAKSRGLLWLLCFFPYWLKTHGVNRKFATLHK